MSSTSPSHDITLQDVKAAVGPGSDQLPAEFRDSKYQAEVEKAELDARKQFTTLRGIWSKWIIVWISVLLAFHIGLTALIGIGLLNYVGYSWFLPMVVVQNFLQIVGMGVVVVRFLYPRGSA